MNEFYRRMDIRNQSKSKLAEIILRDHNSQDTLVIDIGAGSCVIDRMLLEGGFEGHIIAIDAKTQAPLKDHRFHFFHGEAIQETLRCFLHMAGFRHIVFVLSAILHELSKEDRADLLHLIRISKRIGEVAMLIREPVFGPGLIKPFAQIRYEYDASLEEYIGLHAIDWLSDDQLIINWLFARSYGPEAWEREKREGRFTFSLEDIESFARIADLQMEWIEDDKDPFYESTLPFGLYDILTRTGNIIMMKG